LTGGIRTTNPFELLTAEHDLLRRNLGTAIETAREGGRRKEGQAALRALLAAFRQHLRLEEKALYPVCERLFGGRESAMVVLRADHEAIEKAIDRLAPGTLAREGIEDRLIDLAGILDAHLSREERVLFPLASSRMSGAESTFLLRKLRK